MRRGGLGDRPSVDQMRTQHLVFDLHLVRCQEEVGTGREQRGLHVVAERMGPRVEDH